MMFYLWLIINNKTHFIKYDNVTIRKHNIEITNLVNMFKFYLKMSRDITNTKQNVNVTW